VGIRGRIRRGGGAAAAELYKMERKGRLHVFSGLE